MRADRGGGGLVLQAVRRSGSRGFRHAGSFRGAGSHPGSGTSTRAVGSRGRQPASVAGAHDRDGV